MTQLAMRDTDLPLIGRVFDGGALPTTTGKYYLVHPVTLGGLETEGGAGSLTVDTSRTVPFYVLGSHAPAVGDDLIGHFAENRWVAERNHSGCPNTPPTATTTPFTFTDFTGTYSTTWNAGVGGWITGIHVGPGASCRYTFYTLHGATANAISVEYWTDGSGSQTTWGTFNFHEDFFAPTLLTCTGTVGSGTGAATYNVRLNSVTGSGFYTVTVNWPA